MKKFFCVQGKLFLAFLALTLICLANASTSFAHKVNIFAYVEGSRVYTESYFPDGRKVEQGTIEVYDSQGKKLLSGTTDKQGKFDFAAPKKDDLKIVIVATMGHKNSYLLSADELPDNLAAGKTKPANEPASEPEQGKQASSSSELQQQATTVATIDLQAIKKVIDRSLDRKLGPIKRDLAKAQEEKVSPTEIIGGIGYIFGIIGIILYFTKKNA